MMNEQLIGLTADIVSAHVSHNTVAVGDVPTLINSIYATLDTLGSAKEAPSIKDTAANKALIRKTLANPNCIISLIDGKPYKTLRRHIGRHGFTPETYREHFGLSKDYPMTARAYVETRRNLALKIGLGRKPKGN